jgi:enoyl-[acyl-carrier protein] reductase I
LYLSATDNLLRALIMTNTTSNIMKGKRGLIMGVANDHSIAWGIAKTLADHGAELALLPCDVEEIETVDATFDKLKSEWGEIDFIVHAIGFSDKNELKGLYADTSRENFSRTMVISAFSFTEVTKRAAELMPNGGSSLTLTYGGANRVMPNYNVMGVAKAALESSVRYLATDYGPQNIRVNAISAGPIRTLAGAGVSDARSMFNYQARNAPLRRTVDIYEVGGSALYLLSDLSSGVTGEIHYVDSGYNTISMPQLEELKKQETKN